ncbi:MAG: hypothetical protein HOB45_05650, partial [Planctomycetaceae bacterium]|nr:hypothetical protein [Planctomycetaceae bacterium]
MVSKSSQIVITGIGATTPLGNSFDAIGDALQAGRSGIDWCDIGTFSRQQQHVVAQVQSVNLTMENAVVSPSWRIDK